jgi:RNA polymerase sigma-70 factor, ECF subfamily
VTDDAELVVLIQKGDDEAFAQLVERYHTRLIRLASSVVANRHVAEEVVQDTWLGVLRGIDGFEGRSSLWTWLYRVCLNRARTAVGKEDRSWPFDPQELGGDDGPFSADGAWASPVEPWSDLTEERIDADALTTYVKNAIESLPAGQRLVVTLRDVEGRSSGEVCEALSITEGNQRVLLHRARSRIRVMVDHRLRGS